MYVKTNTFLDRILAHKQEELRRSYWEAGGNLNGGTAWKAQAQHYAETAPPPRNFAAALWRETVALIAEVKQASPSKGVLIEDFDPITIGRTYAENGAAAISVLTDERFFQGSLRDMRDVRGAVSVPVLRKDFIIDSYQVYEGRASGADAMLLIAAALEDKHMADLYAQITGLGMTALVEVHTEDEMERALKIGAKVVGINNRDLKTFEVDLNTTERLARLVPNDVILVAESGIMNPDDVRRMGDLGAHAVLVGESLMKSSDMAAAVRAFSAQARKTR